MFNQRWRSYNDPLVELVLAGSAYAGEPVHILDVGAGVGDTAILLGSSAPRQIASFTAVEGDGEFVGYLEQNLVTMGFATSIWPFYLSQFGEALGTSVRTHPGTAILSGEPQTQSRRLDDAWRSAGSPQFGIVKIDTEGHDGRVLAGAIDLLTSCRPLVLFEWHPRLLEQTGNDPQQPFEVLAQTGYDRFVWFDKFGEFSHIAIGHDRKSVDAQARFCLASRSLPDWHYDVAAIPAGHPLSHFELADLMRARAEKRPVLGSRRGAGFRYDPRSR